MTEHIVRSYDTELKELRSIVSRMGGMAEEQLADAMKALNELDINLANTIRKQDHHIDDLELKAEQASMSMFARRAPVADDLREVVSVLKMTTMIERMGDYAKNIARRTIAIAEDGAVELPETMQRMAQDARHMIQDVIDAYVHRDPDAAVEVWEHDETLDNMHNAAYRQIIAEMMENPSQINALTHLLMIAKNLERIGDQATNVAEHVYYAITGLQLEDTRPKGDATSDGGADV